MQGKIKTLKNDKGFGFIKASDGVEYFFHRSEVRRSSFDDLRLGDDVAFEVSDGSKGPRAADVYRT